MTRIALYARYFSDQQSAASIEDQLRVCRERAERKGWHIVHSYRPECPTEKGAALSGSPFSILSPKQG